MTTTRSSQQLSDMRQGCFAAFRFQRDRRTIGTVMVFAEGASLVCETGGPVSLAELQGRSDHSGVIVVDEQDSHALFAVVEEAETLVIDLRELIGWALGTEEPDVLDVAEGDFRGVYGSIDEYVRGQLAEQLPEFMGWVLRCCEAGKLREGYENGAVRVWGIGLPDGRVLVFESPRA